MRTFLLNESPRFLFLFLFWSLFFCAGYADPIAQETFDEYIGQLKQQAKTDAPKAVLAAQDYLKAHAAELSSNQVGDLYYNIAYWQSNLLKDVPAAIHTYEEGMERIGEKSPAVALLRREATLLISVGQPAQAQQVLDKYWPYLDRTANEYSVLPVYVSALREQKKSAEISPWLQRWIEQRTELALKRPVGFTLLIDQLIADKNESEALGFARLFFAICPYRDDALTLSTGLLSKVWTAQGITPPQIAERIEALQNTAKPNPLQEVKLPTLDAAKLADRLRGATTPQARITLMLAMGQYREAMLQARKLMLDKPQSTDGMLEVCRVFKAHDLSLMRANAFLEYIKSGQGTDPTIAFLQETEANRAG